MFKCKFYMKSGNVVEAIVGNLTISETSESVKFTWNQVPGHETLMRINVDNVEAVTYIEIADNNDNDD